MTNPEFDLNVTLFVEQSALVELDDVREESNVFVLAGQAGPKGRPSGIVSHKYSFSGDSLVLIEHNMGARPINVSLFDSEFNPFFAGTRVTENEIEILLCEFVDGIAVVLFDFS